MVSQKIRDIKGRDIRDAKRIMAVLRLLGLDEDDLLLLKEIPAMRAEIDSLKESNESLRKALSSAESKAGRKTLAEQMSEMYAQGVEEFNPDGR